MLTYKLVYSIILIYGKHSNIEANRAEPCESKENNGTNAKRNGEKTDNTAKHICKLGTRAARTASILHI